MIELWQADSEGNYAHQGSRADGAAFGGFGRLATAEDGSCTFETIRPGCVPGPGETVQAPHINVSILGRGILKRLSTRALLRGGASERRRSHIGFGAGKSARDVVGPARSGSHQQLDFRSAPSWRGRDGIFRCVNISNRERPTRIEASRSAEPNMSGRLIESLATTPALAALFSDESVLQAMLEFETALARAEARTGVIPLHAADAISAAAKARQF